MRAASTGLARVALLALAAGLATSTSGTAAADAPDLAEVPRYEVDPSWPRLPLPNQWALGQLAGVAVDADGNVWILQRPGTLYPWETAAAATPPVANCCVPAPPVIQFDPSGKVLRAWGGPGEGYDWPAIEHGLYIDQEGNIWIGGSRTDYPGRPADGPIDGMVLKFTPEGEFLMQIGGAGPSEGSLDETRLGGAADLAVYPPTNEVFIADGYAHNRVIVFDADTGAFKRMWGAYGKPPTDEQLAPYDPAAPPPKQFRTVHCIGVSTDGIVYVCDRDNNRVQAFGIDGSFVTEWFYRKDTLTGRGRGPGTTLDLAFSPDREQRTILVADAPNSEVVFVRRSDGEVIGSFGHYGNYAGQLNRLHQLAVDSKGNIYTAEATGKRIQKFVRVEARGQ